MLNPFVEIPYHPIISVGLPFVLGSLSGIATKDAVRSSWYTGMRAPAYRPPRQVFPIVWPYLYLTMGLASYLVNEAARQPFASAETKRVAGIVQTLYWVQLGLNMLWSPTFFSWRLTGPALADILALTGTVFAMTYQASQLPAPPTGRWSWITPARLFLPYCAWLTFATYLNGGYWFLNDSPWAGKGKGKARAD